MVKSCVGLKINHSKRDLEIPKHRERLLKAIEKDLLTDDNVLAVFYGGSIGNNNTDLYSDIDLRIVVKDEMFENYRLNKKERAKNLGNVMYFEDFSWATHSIAHFEEFLKVDSFYYKMSDVIPSVWLQNIKIVKDSNGRIKGVQNQSKELSYKPSLGEVDTWRNKFFAFAHETYRSLKRNELYSALNYLDALRLSMAAAWYMEESIQPNTFGDWSKLEGNRSKLTQSQLALLKSWRCNPNAEEVMNVIKRMLPEFKRVDKSLCERVGLQYDEEMVEKIFKMVL
jgi:hypothetical protein